MAPGPPALARALTPAVRMELAIAVATGLYGISFGALSVAAGLTVAQATASSQENPDEERRDPLAVAAALTRLLG